MMKKGDRGKRQSKKAGSNRRGNGTVEHISLRSIAPLLRKRARIR